MGMLKQVVTVQSAPRIYCKVRGTKYEQPRPGALPMRRKEPAPPKGRLRCGLVTVKELVTEQLQKVLTKLRRGSWYPLYYTFYHRCKVDPHTILFESRQGKAFESSVFALLKETVKSYPGQYRLIVCAGAGVRRSVAAKLTDSGIRVQRIVRYGGPAYYHELSRAGYLINDTSFPGRFVKKPGQRYLNVWHGTPLKKMGKDNLSERISMGNVMRNFLMADLLLYPNRYMQEKMVSAYMLDKLYDGRVLHTGYPRNDIFFRPEEGRELKKKLGVEKTRLLAYLPTWREGTPEQIEANLRVRRTQLQNLDALLTDDECIFYKSHPLEKGMELTGMRHVRAFPEGIDTSQVLNACDALITDYSSTFFDFASTGRPIFLFPYDRADYEGGRGLYLDPVTDLPFPVAETAQELAAMLHARDGYGSDGGGSTAHAGDAHDGNACCKNGRSAYMTEEFRQRYLTWENGHGSRDALSALLEGTIRCEAVSIHTDTRPNVLLYAGDLAQNGVTAAFCNLYPLLDRSKTNYFVSFRTESVKEDPSRMDRLPEYADLFPLGSEMNLDPVTGLAQAIYLKWGFGGLGIRERLTRAYRTEWEKHFPGTDFSHLYHYNGYENYILSLMLHAPVPCTVGVHSNMEEEIRVRHNVSRPLLRDVYRHCARVICVSADAAGSVTSISGRKEEVLVAANCQNPERIRRMGEQPLRFDPSTTANVSEEELDQILGLDEKRFICIGRFSPEKGILRLMSAFERFAQTHMDCRLILAGGGGPLYEEVLRKAGESPVKERIIVVRAISNPMPILKRCHLLMVPSEYEGCPVVPYEADFLDVPCACCDVPGCHELMQRWGGMLVPPDEEGLLTAMQRGYEGTVSLMHIDPAEDNKRTLELFA